MLTRVKACPPYHYNQLCVLNHDPSFRMIPWQMIDLWSCCFPHWNSKISSTALALSCPCLPHPWPWPLPAGLCCCGRRGKWELVGTRLWDWACCDSIEPMCSVHTSGARSLGPRWCRLGRSRYSRARYHMSAGNFQQMNQITFLRAKSIEKLTNKVPVARLDNLIWFFYHEVGMHTDKYCTSSITIKKHAEFSILLWNS